MCDSSSSTSSTVPALDGTRRGSGLFVREQRNVHRKWRSRFDRPMNTKTTGLILALCFFGAALGLPDDPQASPSNLNESKSKVTSGTEKAKPTYVSLVKFTDKGIQNARQTTQRLADWAAKVQSMGVTIKQMYWNSASMTKRASSRPRTTKQLPVCYWQQTCWQHSHPDDARFHSRRDG